MDFNLTEPQRMFRDSVAAYARKELAAAAVATIAGELAA